MKNKVVELALRLDHDLLRLIRSHDRLREHFFVDIENIAIFDKVKFQQFVSNKAFLPDSYTAFKNKIGLMDGDQYLVERQDVVLAWPYKDCVLEGGQDREDAQRQEVFWNETLAPDQIDRLLTPKILVGAKRYTRDGVANATSLTRDDNLIIKGNNLLALHTLMPIYRERIKVIYIDPPYNTEHDSFNYNDRFNHSTWLTFMKSRLEVARQLLTPDGIIFVSLDDKEAHYCKVMMDSIFGRENFVADICHKARASVSNDKIISSSHNHLLFYARNERLVNERRKQFGIKNDLTGFDLNDGTDDYKLVPVDGPGGSAKGNPFYQFLGVSGYWRFSQSTMQQMHDDGLIVKTGNGLMQKYYKKKAAASKKTVTTWWDEGFLTSTATGELRRLMGADVFSNPKNVALLKRIIELWTVDGDIVLDFFAGSGTTGHAALELQQEDKQRRQFILCEQMEYENGLPSSRVQKVLQDNASFVQVQLAQANEKFIQHIQASKSEDDLAQVWQNMQQRAFLSYRVDVRTIDPASKDWLGLSLGDKKRLLMDTLDKNMLYVPLSEMDDATWGISDSDKALNRAFFGV